MIFQEGLEQKFRLINDLAIKATMVSPTVSMLVIHYNPNPKGNLYKYFSNSKYILCVCASIYSFLSSVPNPFQKNLLVLSMNDIQKICCKITVSI